MNARTTREEVRAIRLNRQEAAGLLSRYPHVSEAETELILTFLRTGRRLDVGMVTADEKLKARLGHFMNDHGKRLRIGFGEGAVVVSAIVGFLVLCWLVWEALKPGAV